MDFLGSWGVVFFFSSLLRRECSWRHGITADPVSVVDHRAVQDETARLGEETRRHCSFPHALHVCTWHAFGLSDITSFSPGWLLLIQVPVHRTPPHPHRSLVFLLLHCHFIQLAVPRCACMCSVLCVGLRRATQPHVAYACSLHSGFSFLNSTTYAHGQCCYRQC